MTTRLPQKLRKAWRKNADEVLAGLTGQLPRFAVRSTDVLDGLPVFVFHDVDAGRFEAQLDYLRRNRYRSLDADETEQAIRGGLPVEREVALTFDDGTANFWTVAFPLLKKYGFRAILFVVPGIVPDSAELYPNLGDVWAGRCPVDALRDTGRPGLCTWTELQAMHGSRLIDVQSHSMTHARVPVSPRIVDFLHREFPVESYANVSIPVAATDDPRRPSRELIPGAPVFENASRMSGRPRFREDPAVAAALRDHVRLHPDRFFEDAGWRRRLRAIARSFPRDQRGSYESPRDTDEALMWEFAESRAVLERVLGKSVRHFCYPWFEGSPGADRLAARAGYASVFYGPRLRDGSRPEAPEAPTRIRRLSEEFLLRLPGRGRASLASVWTGRLRGFASGSRRT